MRHTLTGEVVPSSWETNLGLCEVTVICPKKTWILSNATVRSSYLVKTLILLVGFSQDKAITLHAWTGPEGSRRLRLPDFKTIST